MTRTESTSVSSDDPIRHRRPRRRMAVRARQRRANRDNAVRNVRRQGHPGPRGPRPGPQAARHVHRLAPASPASTTSSGRSSTTRSTRRWPATAPASTSPCWPTAAAGSSTTAAASPSTRTREYKDKSAAEIVLTMLHAGGKFGGEGYKVSGGLHGVGVRSSTRCPSGSSVEVDRDGKRHAHGVRRRRQAHRASSQVVGDAPARPHRHHRHVLARPDGLRGDRVPRPRRSLERLQMMAFLNKGLEIRFNDERAEPRAEGHATSTPAASSTS